LLLITTFLQEFITSSTTLAALFGGLVAGILSDWTGRRPVLAIADIIFIGGAIAQAVCHDVWSMVSRDFNLLSIYVNRQYS
jgi:SP family myo-inositol transporter-like MFS transporter 13